MTHIHSSAVAVLPPAPASTVVKTRYLDGKVARQHFTSGGFYSADSPRWRMRQMDLAKAAALTIDVDAYDYPAGAARWGSDRAARKQAMRDASAEDVLSWMEETDFIARVYRQARGVGLPDTPNRTIFTGQGLCLVYWLEDGVGWADETRNKWTPDLMKQVIKRFHAATDLWWWDSSAKDVGTRIFPVPGSVHRDTGKTVQVLQARDTLTPLLDWFEVLANKYPEVKARAAARKASASAAPRQRSSATPSGSWTRVIYSPLKHTPLAMGERAEACPLCGGSGYKRLAADHISCFSCKTLFSIVEQKASAPPAGSIEIPLDGAGRACWPPQIPSHTVNAARTATGKTHLMGELVKGWLQPGHFQRRVLAIAPTITLADELAARLGLTHGDSSTSVRLANDSLVCCFAGLESKTAGTKLETLKHTYLLIDEGETCLGQLLGLFADGERARRTYNLLIHTAAYAARVHIADAHSGPVVARFIADVAGYCSSVGIPAPEWTRFHTQPHRFQFRYVSPVYRQTKKGPRITRSADNAHKGLIAAQLADGKRLAVYVPGREAALGLARTVRARFPDRKVVCIVGLKGTKERHDLSAAGLTADVLIYNNAMGTGVSYDVPDHYDAVHVLLGRASISDSQAVEQAIHRIRQPRSRVIAISGPITAAVTDWRTTAAGQLNAAIERWEAGQTLGRRLGVQLAGDWVCSPESKRLARMQAEILAGRYQRGYRWVLAELAARHDFSRVDGEIEDDFSRQTLEERDAARNEEALAIATAVPLGPAALTRADDVGPATEREWNRWQAARLERMYGVELGDSSTPEGVAARATVALATRHKKLWPKIRVFTAMRLIMNGLEPLAAAVDQRQNARQTVMTCSHALPAARVVWALITSWVPLGMDADGKTWIAEDDARQAIRRALPKMKTAGLKPRADWKASPFKQVQSLLRLAGLKLYSQRDSGGARQRRYYFCSVDLDEMWRLSTQRYQAILDADAKAQKEDAAK